MGQDFSDRQYSPDEKKKKKEKKNERGSSYTFYKVTYYIKGVTTSWTSKQTSPETKRDGLRRSIMIGVSNDYVFDF